jgi:hypothetical protein
MVSPSPRECGATANPGGFHEQKGIDVLTAQLKQQAEQIQKVSARLEVSKPATKVVLKNP